jgi:predicted histone-like DNA-binding protein
MAIRQIQFPIVYKQNTNSESAGYGHYYPYAWKPETLELRGLIERVAMDQSVYSRDIVEGVIQRLTKVMVELLEGGQPVKWDGLGTFTPSVESVKGGYTEHQIKAGANVRDVIAGVHIRFIPENEKGEEITSRKFKDLVTFVVEGIARRVEVGTTAGGKTKYATNIQSLEDFKSGTNTGGSGTGGSGTNTGGGDNGGGTNTGGNSGGGDNGNGEEGGV